VGGLVLTILNWVTAGMLPPRYQQFRNPRAVIDVIRENVGHDDIYTAPPGLFVSVALAPRTQGIGPRFAAQFVSECAVALALSLLLSVIPVRSSLRAAALLGVAGLAAGLETHFPNWNWAGFPTSYLLAGVAYLGLNWFLTGLVLSALRPRQTSR